MSHYQIRNRFGIIIFAMILPGQGGNYKRILQSLLCNWSN